jgi:hypothetical protein
VERQECEGKERNEDLERFHDGAAVTHAQRQGKLEKGKVVLGQRITES